MWQCISHHCIYKYIAQNRDLFACYYTLGHIRGNTGRRGLKCLCLQVEGPQLILKIGSCVENQFLKSATDKFSLKHLY